MKQIILWLFSQISNFVSTSMTWKIYGDFSLTHFILGGMFLIALFKLFGFSFENTGNFSITGFNLWKNIENKNDKKNYYDYTKSNSVSFSHNGRLYTDIVNNRYKVNKHTGVVKSVGMSRKQTSHSEL